MYKSCKTETALQMQKKLADTLLSMMKQQKYRTITVASLCREADCPRNSFYRYYENLDDVLFFAAEGFLRDAFLLLVDARDYVPFFEYWLSKKSFLDSLEMSGLSQSIIFCAAALWVNGRDILLYDADMLRKSCQINSIMTLLFTWHHSGMNQTTRELSDLMCSVFPPDNL